MASKAYSEANEEIWRPKMVVELPKKWTEGHWIGEEKAFLIIDGSLNFAPPIITSILILGTFVRATPCKTENHAHQLKIEVNFLLELEGTTP